MGETVNYCLQCEKTWPTEPEDLQDAYEHADETGHFIVSGYDGRQ